MSRSVQNDYESCREAQARSQEADRVTSRQERDLAFAGQVEAYEPGWVDEVEKV